MKALDLKLWAVLPVFLFIYASQSSAQSICDAPEVKLDNNLIQIAPTGVDDTANIQCALDLAVERNIPEIRLTRGDFYIGALSAQDFVGTLQGGGRDHTRISLLDQSIDCGNGSAAITFAGGEPRIRWLTLAWPAGLLPCVGNSGWLGTLLHFTGVGDNVPSCSSDVIYATIDRATLQGPARGGADVEDFSSGVEVSAADGVDPACRNTLLGTFRINRSVINTFGTGASVTMQGGAQVGVHNNSFEGNHYGLSLAGSSATVSVSGNRFASTPMETPSSCHGGAVGINVGGGDVSQEVVRLDVHGNTLEVTSTGWCSAFGLWLQREPGASEISIVISGNEFLLSGPGVVATAVQSVGVSGAVVSGNRFTEISPLATGLVVAAWGMDEVTGWTVVSNTGFADLEEWGGIFLGENVSKALIGPDQGAIVIDEGYDNTVLPQ